jgi:DNA-binding Xre family transcriptional regulator
MTAKLDYRWHLREIMATQGMFSTTELRPLLADRGVTLSTAQVWRLVTERPERLNLNVLMALLDILSCRMEDLIEPKAGSASRQRKVASGETEPSTGAPGKGRDVGGVGAFRPTRARIAPDPK